MRLVNFSVTNFRSITQAYKIPFSNLTVLIGKNNEGKSNMLKALNISMNILEYHANQRSMRYGGGYSSRNNDNYYKWERDFPISLQDKKNTTSIFRLEFELDSINIQEFKDEIKSNLNGTLPIEIKIGKEQIPKIRVIKKGLGAKTLNQKSKKIAEYVARKIQFNYISAIRTDKESMQVVDQMLAKELESIEIHPDYIRAIQTIKDLQTPVLEQLSESIKHSLKEFLPNIKSVSIETQEERRRVALRQQFEIFIDDGSKTNLEFKGDGVKSLSALGLLKNITKVEGAFSLIAIEEPESHLHPGAIHILKETIFDLGLSSQVIISTHNPLFVNRQNIKSNIIIDSGKAHITKNIKELRELIGIKASDNLVNASYVLVVEGEEDVISLNAILPFLSDKISKAIRSNILVIDKIGGASNLSYKLSLLNNALCTFHVFLDNDKAGVDAYEKAVREDNLKIKDFTLVNCNGMVQSEFEDCLNKEIYEAEILSTYGVNISVPQFKGNTKWSDRMRQVFLNQGKPWTDKIEAQVKNTVALTISKDVANSLNQHKRNSIDSLVITLENLLDNIK
jgi:predicted ATP-dependent endonuclease of OLD family